MIFKMKVIITILLISTASAFASTATSLQLKITGGRNAKKGELPYVVSLQYQPKQNPSAPYKNGCGGSIISINWILTAAHCVENSSIVFKVVAGINRISDKDGQEREIIKKMFHQNYKKGQHLYDIALLQLDKPLKLNNLVKTISLPKPGDKFTGDVVGSGWGSTSASQRIYPDDLQTAVFPLISNEQCKNIIKHVPFKYNFSDHLNICTGSHSGYSGLCNGDSGGPIVQKDVIIGVTSWGPISCAGPLAVTVSTNVASFIPFIKANVHDLPK